MKRLIQSVSSLFAKPDVQVAEAITTGFPTDTLSNLLDNNPKGSMTLIGSNRSERLKFISERFFDQALTAGTSLTIAGEYEARWIYNALTDRVDEADKASVFIFDPSNEFPLAAEKQLSKVNSDHRPSGHFILYAPDDLFDDQASIWEDRALVILNQFYGLGNPENLTRTPEIIDRNALKIVKKFPVYCQASSLVPTRFTQHLMIQTAQARSLGARMIASFDGVATGPLLDQAKLALQNASLVVFTDTDLVARRAQLLTVCDYYKQLGSYGHQDLELLSFMHDAHVPVIENRPGYQGNQSIIYLKD